MEDTRPERTATSTESPARAESRPALRSDPRRERRPRRPMMRRKVCYFCVEKVGEPNYKRPDILKRFLGDRGMIRGRRQSALCAKHQRRTTRAIKWARELALLPFVTD